MIALVAALMLGQPAPAPRVVNELADGFYCSTPHYFAYETLLHPSPEPHLLHIVSLDDRTGRDPETIKPLPSTEARGLRCNAGSAELVADRPSARETERLWGDGSWARTASQRRTLKRFPDQSRIDLEIDRVSSGGDDCLARVGARLVWKDRRGRELRSRPVFHRPLTCRRAHLNGGPLRDDCAPQPGRVLRVFAATIAGGASLERRMGPFTFELRHDASAEGWRIGVRQGGREITALIPLHGATALDVGIPSAREIQSKRFDQHPFHFHPDVGRTIRAEPGDAAAMLADDVRIEAYGRGLFEMVDYSTGSMQFRVCASWPTSSSRR